MMYGTAHANTKMEYILNIIQNDRSDFSLKYVAMLIELFAVTKIKQTNAQKLNSYQYDW